MLAVGRLHNIVAADNNKLGLVLEAMDGDLRAKLEAFSGGLVQQQVRIVFRGLCSGLRYLHALSLVHADVKPANVLTRTDHRRQRSKGAAAARMFTVKLGDLGAVEQVRHAGARRQDRTGPPGPSFGALTPYSAVRVRSCASRGR